MSAITYCESVSFATIACAIGKCRGEEHALLVFNHGKPDEHTIAFHNVEAMMAFSKDVTIHVAEFLVHRDL